ncbi:MAG: MBOAT family protein [Clostridia bacterium]|nr:MBOAT family protein [Clostridia bacterium]
MSILSIYFLLFLLLSSLIFYALPNKLKPLSILAANIYFYIQFGLKHLPFLLFSIVSTFAGALLIERLEKKSAKKAVLASVLFLNIGLLFYVKFTPYLLNLAQKVVTFDSSNILKTIIVPVGIAFYTLQLCGYIVDVYREKYVAERNFLKFAAFGTFFPLILQGPISRYDQLADQIYSKAKRENIYRNYTYGAQLMLWGFFKKLVVADRAAILVNEVFGNYTSYSGLTVALAVLFYTIQIYMDFSGCVDICRGAAQLFGINVIENFKQPYFASSTQDFWRRWHIALSSWFRDYLYIPLGGNRMGAFRKYLNILIVFFASGLWHGVGFHYIVWGLMQGLFQIVGAITLPLKKKICDKLMLDRTKGFLLLWQQLITFCLINLSWLVFRANGTTAAIAMFKSIFTLQPVSLVNLTYLDLIIICVSLLIVFFVSYYKEKGFSVRDELSKQVLPVRWSVFLILFAAVVLLGVYGPGYSDSSFIYMNF